MTVNHFAEMRRLMREVVSPWAEVVECADGDECVAQHAIARPDWLLMDIRMPRLDGLGAARVVRRQAPEARILMLSQDPSPALDQAAVAAGAAGCLPMEDLHRVPELLSWGRSRVPDFNSGVLDPLTCHGA